MKLKRFLTGVLSAVMALSVCALPAAAAEGATTKDNTPVWKTGTGSITIHKYDFTGTGNTANGNPEQQVPQGATALGGVTFHVYKVQDEEWLKAYYSGEGTVVDKDLSKIDPSDYYDSIDYENDTVTFKTGVTAVDMNSQVTAADTGLATFDNLEYGLYLVVETKAPKKVTQRTEPFLVSVPMTRTVDYTKDSKVSEANADWLYDVHVYPKNSTAMGTVTIQKEFYVGDEKQTALAGVSFGLQKKQDDDTWIDVIHDDEADKDYTLTTDNTGKLVIAHLPVGVYQVFEKEYTGDSKKGGYILDGAKYEFEVMQDSTIKYNNTTYPSLTLTLANHKPDLKKEVSVAGTPSAWGNVAQYGKDDVIPYKITVTIPQNIDKLGVFTVSDSPKGLKDNKGSISIANLTANTHYEVKDNADNTNGFVIEFKPNQMRNFAGQKVEITYNATLDESTALTIGGNGNSNKAKLVYTNEIDEKGDPVTGTENHIEDSAAVYTYSIQIHKTNEAGVGLSGVTFDLYKKVSTTGVGTAVDEETYKKVGLEAPGDDMKWVFVQTLTSGEDGKIDTANYDNGRNANYIAGLANGEYWLVETKTVNGYNLLNGPVKLELNIKASETWSATTVDEDGNVTKHGEVTSTTYNGGESNNSYVLKNIVNRKGFQLPVTGGFGTLLFSGIGVLLVLAGVAVLFSMKKKNDRA